MPIFWWMHDDLSEHSFRLVCNDDITTPSSVWHETITYYKLLSLCTAGNSLSRTCHAKRASSPCAVLDTAQWSRRKRRREWKVMFDPIRFRTSAKSASCLLGADELSAVSERSLYKVTKSCWLHWVIEARLKVTKSLTQSCRAETFNVNKTKKKVSFDWMRSRSLPLIEPLNSAMGNSSIRRWKRKAEKTDDFEGEK